MAEEIFVGIAIIILPILSISIGIKNLIKSIKAISTDDLDLMIKMANFIMGSNEAKIRYSYTRKDEKFVRKYGIKSAIFMCIFLIVIGLGWIYFFYESGFYNSTLILFIETYNKLF